MTTALSGGGPPSGRGGQPPPGGGGQSPGRGGQTPGTILYSQAASGIPQSTKPGAKNARSYAQIIQDEKSNRNILEIKLRKITKETDGVTVKPRNLTQEDISELFFDTLKIDPKDCLGIAIFTNRYDCKEIKLRPHVDATKYLTTSPLIFKDHEIQVKKQLANVTRVTFRNVPFSIPDEELLHLCSTYGELVDNIVMYEKPTYATRGVCGATRFVNVRMKRGMQMENFYFLQGPLEGDRLVRVTALHPGQIPQCSHCLRRAPKCPGAGNGKLCEEANTPRGSIQEYMDHLRSQFDYVSLCTRYKEIEFPSLDGKPRNGSFVEDEKEEEEEEECVAENENLKQKLNDAEIKIANLNEEKQQASKENSFLHSELEILKTKLRETMEKQTKVDVNDVPPGPDKSAEELPEVMIEASPANETDTSISSVTIQEEDHEDPLKTNDLSLNSDKDTLEKCVISVEAEKAKNTAENGNGENEIMKIKINKNTSVHMRKSNFSYNKEADSLTIIDEKEFTQELQIKCNAKSDREKKIKEMREKTLVKIKNEFKNQPRERSNSIRRRSEEENDENNPAKAQRKSSSSSLPYPLEQKTFFQSLKSTLAGHPEPTLESFRGRNHLPKPEFKSSIPAPTKS